MRHFHWHRWVGFSNGWELRRCRCGHTIAGHVGPGWSPVPEGFQDGEVVR